MMCARSAYSEGDLYYVVPRQKQMAGQSLDWRVYRCYARLLGVGVLRVLGVVTTEWQDGCVVGRIVVASTHFASLRRR